MENDKLPTYPEESVVETPKPVTEVIISNYSEKDDEKKFYPDQDDPNFNIKLAAKKEFRDLIKTEDTRKENVEEFANKECTTGFQILPHQQFVKNFISVHTPFNSLLLYHELGTGKTCSAIGVAEELRRYMKRSGIIKKTIVVGNHNVLSNFRLQLFDSTKLKEPGKKGLWTLDTCVGSALLDEVNEFHYEGKTREQVSKQINQIIDTYYDFVGYRKLANLIEAKLDDEETKKKRKSAAVEEVDSEKLRRKKLLEISRMKNVFDNTLFIIDEAHNILQRDENKKKRAAKMLVKLAKHCDNLKFLLLTATPMYNSHQEMIWLVNLMNTNDNRPIIKPSDVFQPNGDFVNGKVENGKAIQEDGRTLLKRKLIGYVSFVRGENPYAFPFRIYPSSFADNEHLMSSVEYPKSVMTSVPLNGQKVNHLDLFVNRFAKYQTIIYKNLIEYTIAQKKRMPNFEETSSFAIKLLLPLISTTNMTYPNENMDENTSDKISEHILSMCHGTKGLDNLLIREETQTADEKSAYVQFKYKPNTLETYKRIFQEPQLSLYSAKISKILQCVKQSKGIVLIYSNFLDAGLIPMALALEEMGIERYCRRPYMPQTMLEMEKKDRRGIVGKYIMITGSLTYSPSNKEDIEQAVHESNINGDIIKVILVSGAGSEGIDLKNVRQVHIMEPWYNLNRLEQVIGRAVRNKSHCALPFSERNVEIYMHTSYLNDVEETVDMYLYRVAERKSVQIGVLSRILKETAVDCLINNNESQNYTEEYLNKTVSLTTASGKEINFRIGDKPFSHNCDYMEKCEYECSPKDDMKNVTEDKTTYNTDHLQANHHNIVRRVRQLFRDRVFYKTEELIQNINIGRPYLLEEIYYTLENMLENKHIWLVNAGRVGYLIESNNTYAFQPIEFSDLQASIYERKTPLDQKRNQVYYKLPTEDEIYLDTTKKVEEEKEEKEEEPIMETEQVDSRGPQKKFKATSTTGNISGISHAIQNKTDGLNVFREKFQFLANEPRKIFKRNIEKKEDTWYICAPLAIKSMVLNHGASLLQVAFYCVSHIVETLPFKQKMDFIILLFKNPEDFALIDLPKEPLANIADMNDRLLLICIKFYFQSKIYFPKKKGEIPQLIICHGTENKHFMFTENKGWEEAGISMIENHEYVKDFSRSFNRKEDIQSRIKQDFMDLDYKESDSCVIGFMGLVGKTESAGFDFKIKNVLNPSFNNKGEICSNKIKSKLLSALNDTLVSIPSEFVYDGYTIKGVEFETREFVCLYELLLRHLDFTTNVLWFMTMEEVIECNFPNLIYIVKRDDNLGGNILVEKPKN